LFGVYPPRLESILLLVGICIKTMKRSKIAHYRTLYNLIELIKMYRLAPTGSTKLYEETA